MELNGKQVGEVKPYDEKTGIIVWDTPYKAGKLEVIGLDKNGKEVSRYAINSSKQPAALVVKQKGITIKKDKGVAQVLLQVVDENGVPVMLSDNEVTCTVSGPGKLLGLEAGNNSDMTDYTDNIQRVLHGHILAYIEATGTAGTVTVKFTSPWLKPVETTITVK